MKEFLKILLAGALALVSVGVGAVPFDENMRYSVRLLDERLDSFNNKDKRVGLTPDQCPGWDYVAGLVGKATLDAWDYYRNDAAMKEKTALWFECVMHYGAERVNDTKFIEAEDLDILNAAKIYCRLYDGAKCRDRKTARTGMQTAADGIDKYLHRLNDGRGFVIADGPAKGGWWHKNKYNNQMWCDGQYMGPALLAQLIEYNTVHRRLKLDLYGFGWDDVVGQMEIAWRYLWNEEDQLLWHVFTVDPEHGGANGWYNRGNAGEVVPGVYHSSECWARACGWYIMALVDILESMDNAGYEGEGRAVLAGQLNTLAVGLARRQDVESGCWYQLPKYKDEVMATFSAEKGGTNTGDDTGNAKKCWNEKTANTAINRTQANYPEASGSCAFVASILKGIRMGYISPTLEVTNAFDPSDVQTMEEIAKRGYRGIINRFVSEDWEIVSSCESAGLSATRNGTPAYYLLGEDVTVNDHTEGKALGPFILAALEYERAYVGSGK